MATVQRPEERYLEFDEYVDFQLDKARNGIKWTDILAAAAGVATLLIGYLVLFVIADHWLFAGGVPVAARRLSVAIVGLIAFAWIGWRVVWPYLRKVNDLYAAQMLEKAEPSLQGSLFGLVDSRRSSRVPHEEVRRVLERRAATTLSNVDVDSTLDRRQLMRTSYLLLAVVLVACVYAIASPKRIGPSLLRAFLPSSPIGVATRTEILDVRPGNTTVLAGEELPVQVMIRGEAPEKVVLYYSSEDRRFVDEPIEMRLVDETSREYQAILIGDAGRGLSQNLTYRIEANDDAAGPFAIDVDQPPSASVTSITSEFPPYTELEPTQRDAPQIDAIEGTNISLAATANRPLKTAKLVFADDDRFLARGEEVPIRIAKDGVTLTASWKLAIRSDGTSPTFYRIECRDAEGKSNPKPAVYPINIRADQPPEVTLHDPKSDLERPANAIIPLLVTARDPDFRLRELTLRLEKQGQELPDRTVLWEGSEAEAAVRHDWDLGPLGLKPGEVLTFFVQARDNREPEFNRRNTPKLNITIIEPVAKEEVERQLAEEKERQEQQFADSEAATQAEADQPAAESAQDFEGKDELEASDRSTTEPAEGGQSNEPQQDREPRNQTDVAQGQTSPVKNDGSQDDKVLRKLLERQRGKGNPEDSEQKETPEKQADDSETDSDAGDGDNQESNEAGSRRKADWQQKQAGQREQASEQQTGNDSTRSQGDETGSESQRDEAGSKSRENDGRKGPQNKAGEGDSEADASMSNDDAGTSNDDAGTSNDDAGTSNDDAGTSNDEAGTSNDDAGTSNDDAGTSNDDAGTSNDEAGTSNDEAGTSNDEAGTSKDEAGTSKEEAGNPGGQAAESPQEKRAPNESPATDPLAGEESPDSAESGKAGVESAGEKSDTDGAASESSSSSTEQTGDAKESSGESGAMATETTDDERADAPPNSTKTDGDAPASTDPQPGEGRPDQKSQRPDSGEQGTGQQNVDGTPDDEQGSQDTGTKPGSQQSSAERTGRPGEKATDQGRPGEGQSENPAEPSGKATSDESSPEEMNPGMPEDQSLTSDESAPRENEPSEPSASSTENSDQGPPGSDSSPSGEGKSGEGKSGEGKSGEGKSGEGKSGEGKSGEGKSGEGKSGEGKSGEGKSGEGESGEGESGEGESGEGESGEGKSGEGKSGEGKSGEGKSGEGKAGEGKAGEGGGKPGPVGGQGGANATGEQSPADGNADSAGNKTGADAEGASENANPEFTKQATDLALQKLDSDLQRGEVDPQLLEELGWTQEDMRRFADRLRKNLQAPTGDETPQDVAQRKEFEHMLKSLSIEKGPAAREGRTDRVRNVEGVGTKNPEIPSAYRDAYEAFTRSVAGRRVREAAPQSSPPASK